MSGCADTQSRDVKCNVPILHFSCVNPIFKLYNIILRSMILKKRSSIDVSSSNYIAIKLIFMKTIGSYSTYNTISKYLLPMVLYKEKEILL